MRLAIIARSCLIALPLAFLAGCMTLAVQGVSESGDETFTGSATGEMDGSGTLNVKSSKGLKCSGTFVYVTRREGRGTFVCEKGQSGSFEFVSTGTRGTGTGRIGVTRFTFTFS